MHQNNPYDLVIIGGGFYGCTIALFLKNSFKRVLIIEKESDLLLRASYNNQARIHNGYHYPRSYMTALRSHANYSQFIDDFKTAIDDKYQMVYAIARNNSKVTAHQFIKFCKSIGTPLFTAPSEVKKLFDERLIEDVFLVNEIVFNAAKLRDILKKKLIQTKIEIIYKTQVTKVKLEDSSLINLYLKNGENIKSKVVINCTYSGINQILSNSSFPKLPLKYELAEMPLLKMPPQLKNMGFTIMDGPFFSVMPFPDKKMHILHHVRYTPQDSSLTDPDKLLKKGSKFIYMIKDASRYIPALSKATYKGSLYEVKTVLTSNENTDARPILFRKDYGIKNFHVILGAKLDNIYDVLEEIKDTL